MKIIKKKNKKKLPSRLFSTWQRGRRGRTKLWLFSQAVMVWGQREVRIISSRRIWRRRSCRAAAAAGAERKRPEPESWFSELHVFTAGLRSVDDETGVDIIMEDGGFRVAFLDRDEDRLGRGVSGDVALARGRLLRINKNKTFLTNSVF